MLIPYFASGISPKSLSYKYATIKTMKAELHQPVHESYLRHRKQRNSQIILPMVLAALVFIAVVVMLILATANGTGDVGRWAAISTMWIAIPTCIMGFVFLALLGGLIYLLGRLLGIAPTYTGRAQDFVNQLAVRIRRIADASAKPIISLNSYGASINRFLGRK
jgi:hypothetical protein